MKGKIKKKTITPCDVPITRWEYLMLRVIDIIGYIIGFILVYVFYAVLYKNGYFKPQCPIGDNGTPCNGGICENGFCQCTNILYSGRSCSDTACPKNSLGQICSGHGFCNPFLNASAIPDVCKWESPSIANNFKPFYTNGWNHPACKLFIQQNPSLYGLPQCACRIPWVGDHCQTLTKCPRDLRNRICSGHGNSSVGYFDNTTMLGTEGNEGHGCQCRNVIHFLDTKYIKLYTPEMLQLIDKQYKKDFQGLYCANDLADFSDLNVTDDAYAFTHLNVTEDSYQCFCDDLHFGKGCQFGKCPEDANGNPCSNNGHDLYGFGYIANTSIPTNHTLPICLKGMVYCEKEKKCRQKCIEHPSENIHTYRCISGVIALETPNCDSYKQDGYLDVHTRDQRKVCKAPNCDMYGVKSTSLSESMTINVDSMVKYFQLTIENTSPSSNMSVELMINNEIAFSKTIPPQTVDIFSGAPELTYDQLSRRLFSMADHPKVHIIMDHLNVYKMFPVLDTFNDNIFRLWQPERNMYVIASIISADYEMIPYKDAQRVFVYLGNDTYQTPSMSIQSEEACLENPSLCAWDKSAVKNTDSLRQVQRNAYITLKIQSLIVDDNDMWHIEQYQSSLVDTVQLIGNSFLTLSYMEILTVKDVRKPCVCNIDEVFHINQTILNAKYTTEAYRQDMPFKVSDKIAAVIPILGDELNVRGFISSMDDNIATITTSHFVTVDSIPLNSLFHITDLEYITGNDNSRVELFPTLCSDGKSSRFDIYSTSLDISCSCNVNGMNTLCTCYEDATCECNEEDCRCDTLHDRALEVELFQRIQQQNEECQCFLLNDEPTLIKTYYPPTTTQWLIMENAVDRMYIQWYDCDHQLSIMGNGDIMIPYHTECSDNIQSVVLLHDRSVIFDYLTLTFSSASLIEKIDVVTAGRIALFPKTLVVSSNEPDKKTVLSNKLTYWSSNNNERPVFMEYHLNGVRDLSSTMIHFRTVGIANFTLEVQLFIWKNNQWTYFTNISSSVIEGSDIRVVNMNATSTSKLRIQSNFPLSIREWYVYSNQQCTCDDIHIRGIAVNASSFDYCTCDDSCSIVFSETGKRVSMGKDGICSDEFVMDNLVIRRSASEMYNVYTNQNAKQEEVHFQPYEGGMVLMLKSQLPFDVEKLESYVYIDDLSLFEIETGDFVAKQYCDAGTDCSDCGNSLRKTVCLPPSINTTRYLNVTYYRQMKYDMSMDFHHLKHHLSIVTPKDCHICPLYTCDNGACADTREGCKDVFYYAKGNGCIQGNVNVKSYVCVCKEHYGQYDCSISKTRPGDPLGRTIPIAEWHTAGGANPLSVIPSATFAIQPSRLYTRDDLLRMNMLNKKRVSLNGVINIGYFNIHASYAGTRIGRSTTIKGVTYETNCPFVAKGPYGQAIDLEMSIEKRDEQTGAILAWKKFPLRDGTFKTYEWTAPYYEFTFDDMPYRCPNNGQCVADPTECTFLDSYKKMCNGQGDGYADGTCICYAGKTTFLYTEENTKGKVFPYAFDDVTGRTNPTRWNEMNYHARDYASLWCQAKDCDNGISCSKEVLKGCFTGTPENKFEDKLVPCLNNPNMCGANQQACARNENLQFKLYCSGNGIIRKRDYRHPPEYYCACGKPRSDIRNPEDVKQITELIPVGFGGEKCEIYDCDETGLHFQLVDETTGRPYKNTRGVELRGKWIGYCNVVIGPDPDDLSEIKKCCEGVAFYEECDYVPCRLNGNIQCTLSEECQPKGGEPLMYPCNKHGKPRKDGTCGCFIDENKGIGYSSSSEVQSDCFVKSSCGLSKVSGQSCNRVADHNDPRTWIRLPGQTEYFPKIKYFEQQVDAIIGRLGEEISNKSIARKAIDFASIEQVRENGYIQIAKLVQADVRGISSCICKFPDNYGSVGMLNPERVGPYKKNIKEGYALSLSVNDPLLIDHLTPQLEINDLVLGEDYVLIPIQRISTYDVNIVGDAVHLSIIRFNVYNPSNVPIIVTFTNEKNEPVCQSITIPASQSGWAWAAPENSIDAAIYCSPTYATFDYSAAPNTDAYRTNCQDEKFMDNCESWQEEICKGLPGALYNPVGSFEVFRGCKDTCCILVDDIQKNTLTSTLKIHFRISDVISRTIPLYFSEITVFGYTDIVLDAPRGVVDYIDYYYPNVACRDTSFMREIFGEDKSYFIPQRIANTQLFSYPTVTVSQAHAICQEHGGHLAVTRSFEDKTGEFLNKACPDKIQGCWVDNSNQNKPKVYQDKHVWKSSCQTLGCYHAYSPSTYFYATPQDNLYVNNWLGGASWADIYNDINNRGGTNGNVMYYWRDDYSCHVELFTGCDCKAGELSDYISIRSKKSYTNGIPQIKFKGSFPYIEHDYQSFGKGSGPGLREETRNQFTSMRITGSCYAILRNAKGSQQVSSNSCQNTKSCGSSNPIGSSFDNTLGGIDVYPSKTNELYEVVFSAARHNWYSYDNYKDLVMGWEHHPYMCQKIQVKRTGYLWGNGDNESKTRLQSVNDVIYSFDNDLVAPVSRVGSLNLDQLVGNAFQSCRSRGRDVPACHTCIVVARSKWIWNQNIHPPLGLAQFANTLAEDKVGLDGKPIIEPSTVWIRLRDQTKVRLQSLMYSRPQMFARMSVASRIACGPNQDNHCYAYEKDWFIDNCLFIRNGKFEAYPCSDSKSFICQRDYTKYTIPKGFHGDECGPSSRIGGGPTKGSTCFTAFPRANRANFPKEWDILDQWLAGTLSTFIQVQEYNYDAIRSYLDVQSIYSLVYAIPEVITWLYGSFSDRPGRQSLGQQPNPISWVDFDIRSMYKEHCGRKCSKETGICHNIIASSKIHCNAIDSLYDTPPMMSSSNVPAILNGVDVTTKDPKIVFNCGTSVEVYRYVISDTFGGVQPGLTDYFNVLFGNMHYVDVQSRIHSPSWFNVGKNTHYTIFSPTTTMYVSGIFLMDTDKYMETVHVKVWLAPLNPTYNLPTEKYVIADVRLGKQTTFLVTVNIATDTKIVYQVVGFDFLGLRPASVIRIGNVLITTDASIARCTTRKGNKVWYEPPVAMISGAPQHRCIHTAEDKIRYNAPSIGMCYCDRDKAGQTCDFPAYSRYDGKQTCGGYSTYGNHKILTSSGDVAIVLKEGVYFDGREYQCACRDVGRILRTRLIPESAFDYMKVYRYDEIPGESLYIYRDSSNELTREKSINECLLESSVLSSWVTFDEAEVFVNFAKNYAPFYIGIEYVDDVFMWSSRNVFLNGPKEDFDCLKHVDVCRALNVYNVVYDQLKDSLKHVTDGIVSARGVSITSPFTLTIKISPIKDDFVVVRVLFVCVGPCDVNEAMSLTSLPENARCNRIAVNRLLGLVEHIYECSDASSLIVRPVNVDIAEIQVMKNTVKVSHYDIK